MQKYSILQIRGLEKPVPKGNILLVRTLASLVSRHGALCATERSEGIRLMGVSEKDYVPLPSHYSPSIYLNPESNGSEGRVWIARNVDATQVCMLAPLYEVDIQVLDAPGMAIVRRVHVPATGAFIFLIVHEHDSFRRFS